MDDNNEDLAPTNTTGERNSRFENFEKKKEFFEKKEFREFREKIENFAFLWTEGVFQPQFLDSMTRFLKKNITFRKIYFYCMYEMH